VSIIYLLHLQKTKIKNKNRSLVYVPRRTSGFGGVEIEPGNPNALACFSSPFHQRYFKLKLNY